MMTLLDSAAGSLHVAERLPCVPAGIGRPTGRQEVADYVLQVSWLTLIGLAFSITEINCTVHAESGITDA